MVPVSVPRAFTGVSQCLEQFLHAAVGITKVKGKGRYSSSWEPHLRATGCHLPYGITHATQHK